MSLAPKPMLDMSVKVAGITLKNPVLAASGSFGYGVEFEDVVTLHRLGGFVVKGLSREPMAGNPPPRLFETAGGMLNAIGLQNIGARAFLEEKLPLLRKIKNIVFFCNVFGHSQDEYEDVVRMLNEGEGIAAYELNVSCPNTKCGGISFGSDPKMLFDVVNAVKKIATRPLIVKLSPNVTSIPDVARAAEEAGADAISLVNTFVAMAIDAETRKSRISNITAGLSGPAIKPIALRMVWEAAKSGEDTRDRHWRYQHRRGCGRVHAGWRQRHRGRHSELLGPLRLRNVSGLTGKVVPGAPHREDQRLNRRAAVGLGDADSGGLIRSLGLPVLQLLHTRHQVWIERQDCPCVRDVEQALYLFVGAGDPQPPAKLFDFSRRAHDDA